MRNTSPTVTLGCIHMPRCRKLKPRLRQLGGVRYIVSGSGRLVVSIHDVTSRTAAEVRYLLNALDAIGARPRVLKVIPNADGRDDLRRDPSLVRLLHEEVTVGSEIVLHGYTHRIVGPFRGSRPARLRARLFAGTAAEFLTLDRAGTIARLEAGRRILEEAGFAPRGFCAPSWLAPAELPSILAQCGFRYYINMVTLVDLACGRRLWTPWFGYMGADSFQEAMIGVGSYASLLTAPLSSAIKVFLHPQGASSSAACRHTINMLARLMRGRHPVTYAELIDQ